MKKKEVAKGIAFVVMFAVLFVLVSKVLCHPEDERNYQWVAGFYEEPENSLDAVYIGSSNCYSFWNPLVAWNEFGITVYPYATNAQPFGAAKYLIKEARKTQPDALYIVNINTLGDEGLGIENLHYLLDYMPFSLNKLQLTHHLADMAGFDFFERMELYFPLIRYHDRWNDISLEDFNYEVNGMKGASDYSSFLCNVNDITKGYIVTDKEVVLEESLKELVEDLLDYCDEEKVKVLFVTVPRCEGSEDMVAKMNAVNALIEERGYPTLNLNGKVEEISLDLTKDYYNSKHTNIHGAVKFTEYLSEYLVDNYAFEDKRNDSAYITWNQAWEQYETIIESELLDLEMGQARLTDVMNMPQNLTANHDDVQVTVSWDPVENAEGYLLFRKIGEDGKWEEMIDTTQCLYEDKAAISTNAGWYYYTVVPYCEENGEIFYGDFSYKGVEIITF